MSNTIEQQFEEIGRLVAEVEAMPDGDGQERTRAIVRAVLVVHSEGLSRILSLLNPQDVTRLARDPVVSSLLLLHDIHPSSMEERVRVALESVAVKLRTRGIRIESFRMEDAVLVVKCVAFDVSERMQSDAGRAVIQDAISEAAPDVSTVTLVGLNDDNTAGFVPIERLTSRDSQPEIER